MLIINYELDNNYYLCGFFSKSKIFNTKKIKYDIKLRDKRGFKFPVIDPPKIITNKIYDQLCEDRIYSKSLKDRLIWLLKFFKFN